MRCYSNTSFFLYDYDWDDREWTWTLSRVVWLHVIGRLNDIDRELQRYSRLWTLQATINNLTIPSPCRQLYLVLQCIACCVGTAPWWVSSSLSAANRILQLCGFSPLCQTRQTDVRTVDYARRLSRDSERSTSVFSSPYWWAKWENGIDLSVGRNSARLHVRTQPLNTRSTDGHARRTT